MGGERDSERERVCGSLCCTVRAFVLSMLQEREKERERESMWKFFCTVKAFVSSRRRERENG